VGLVVALLLASGVLALVLRDRPEARESLLAPIRSASTTTAPTTTTIATTTTTLVPPGPPVAAGDPDGLATQLVAAETAVRDPAVSPDMLAYQAHMQQVTTAALVDHPDWLPVVLAKAPPEFHGSIQSNLHAGQELRILNPKSMQKLPSGWVIVAPAAADELLAHYKEAEATFGVPWQYLAAINLVETRMGRIRGTSSAGAQGPMQFMPQTWARFGQGDIQSNRDSILAAARYLKYNNAPQTMNTALWNYNRSWHYVAAVTTYAEQMRADERSFRAYYHWQVYYRTVAGAQLLPEGWTSPT
jgi:membrane-bound lytic murein transglycosylase B